MHIKQHVKNYQMGPNNKKSFAILDFDRIRPDLLTILVLSVIFLWIIPIDFEKLISPLLDIRNISYFLILFISLPYFGHIINEVNKNAKIIWTMFFLYFALEGLLYYYHGRGTKTMYYAVWMLLTMGSIFYVGSSPRRLCLLFKLLVISIGISTIFGLLESSLGEPFTSIRIKLVGLSFVEFRELQGLTTSSEIVGQMSGLTTKVFTFSYQIAVLPIASFALFHYSSTRKARWFWGFIFIISIFGIFANAERSAVLSSFIGLIFLINIILKTKSRKYYLSGISIAILLFSIILLLQSSLVKKQKFSLGKRIENTESSEFKARLYLQIAGIKTIVKNPLGVANSKDYRNIARSYPAIMEYVSSDIPSPHNHFINVSFRTGWVGIFLGFLIFIYIKKCIDVFRYKARLLEDRFVWIYYGIVTCFVANLINSCFHNNGLFFGEPAGMLMLALIGAGASMTYETVLT